MFRAQRVGGLVGIRTKTIPYQLGDVVSHIKKAPGIGGVLADRLGPTVGEHLGAGTAAGAVVGRCVLDGAVAAVVGGIVEQGLITHGVGVAVAGVKHRGGAGAV